MPNDFSDRVRKQRDDQKRQAEEKARQQALLKAITDSGGNTQESVTSAIHDLMLATLVSKDPRLVDISKGLVDLLESVKSASSDLKKLGLGDLPNAQEELVDLLKSIPDAIASNDRTDELIQQLRGLETTVKSKNTSANVTVEAPSLDLRPLEKLITRIESAISSKATAEFDTSQLQEAVSGVEGAVRELIDKPIPVPVTPLPFKNASNEGVQALVDADGHLQVDVLSGGGGGSSNGTIVDGTDAGIKATVLDYTNANPLAVRLTDTNGDYVASGGGGGSGTEYTEDAVSAADPTGGMLMARRRDTLSATEVSADGDNIALNATNKGQLHVKHADSIAVTDNASSLTVDQGIGLEVTGSAGALNADLIASTNVSDYRYVSVQIQGTFVGTLTFQGSNDNTTFVSIPLVPITTPAGVPAITTTTTGIWIGPVAFKYFRVRMTLYTSGTATGIAELYYSAAPLHSMGVGSGTITTLTTLTNITNWGNVVDNGAFVDGTTRLSPNGYIFDEVAGTALTENDAAAARIDEKRAQIHILEDGTTRGRRATVTAGGALLTDSSAVTQPISGSITANAGTNLNTSALATEATLAGAIKTEDAAHASGDKGVMPLAVRNDSGSALAGTDGDYIPLSTDSSGALRTTGGGSSGTQYVEDVAAAGDPTGTMHMAVRQDTLSGTTVSADGDNIALRATSKGEMYVKQTDAVPVTDNGGSLTVDGTFWQATQPVSASSLPLPTGAATAAKQPALGTAGSSSTDVISVQGIALGTALPVSGTFWQATQPVSGTVTANLSAGTNTNEVVGDVAQDAAIAGNPVNIGLRASTAVPTAMSADGDAVYGWATREGALVSSLAATSARVGASMYFNSALSNTKQAANASAGGLYGYHIYNPNSTVIYVQFFNVASASVTVGTTTPNMVLVVPAGGWVDSPVTGPPIDFGTALTIAATTTVTGSGAPTTGLTTNLWYK